MKATRAGSEKEKDDEGGGRMPDCSLDAQGCVSLQKILQAFNTTISEEHAWALFYQCAKCFSTCFHEHRDNCFELSEPKDIILHKDGTIHPRTLLLTSSKDYKTHRKPVRREVQLVVSLALVVYQALDYAQSEDEERLISPDLESIISEMTAIEDDCGYSNHSAGGVTGRDADGVVAAPDTDDEGIERDAGEPELRAHTLSLNRVAERCAWRLGDKGGGTSGAHYQAVCRALVAEALELSSFVARVRTGGARTLGAGDDAARHLDNLPISDWARFWMQVIGELRMGVKLKKVSYSRTPIEYELTPYEILMDDIRSRRYTLRKVDVVPHRVKKDAHAMILDFIRSRPPLKKASERKLPPSRRVATPREQLLASIQRGRTLRPTHTHTPQPPYRHGHTHHYQHTNHNHHSTRLELAGPRRRAPAPILSPDEPVDVAQDQSYWDSVSPAQSGSTEAGRGESESMRRKADSTPVQPMRRLIKVDFDDLEDDDEEDNEVATSPPVSASAPRPFPRAAVTAPRPHVRTESPPRAPPRTHVTHDEYHHFCDTTLESYDLATQCPSRRASLRRHTMGSVAAAVPLACQSVPHSRPDSRQSSGGGGGGELSAVADEVSWSRNSLQDDLIKSVSPTCKKQWQDVMSSDERLSLTLEEIVHIRSVLTKAELEVLPVEGRVKEDVEKRRVCFLCLKTRFGIFGPWGQRCKLCKKTVCQKCYSKMRIPTEHFSNVPVVLLSPSLLPSPEDENSSFPRSLMARLMSPQQNGRSDNSVGSAPSSPSLCRRDVGGVHSAPGSRGGSALGYRDSPPALSLPPAPLHSLPSHSLMSRSMEVGGAESLPPSMHASPISTLDRRSRQYRGGGASERLRGMQMCVCHDCKSMVLQIIKSSRASRSATRNHALKQLTLNLCPVYSDQC